MKGSEAHQADDMLWAKPNAAQAPIVPLLLYLGQVCAQDEEHLLQGSASLLWGIPLQGSSSRTTCAPLAASCTGAEAPLLNS